MTQRHSKLEQLDKLLTGLEAILLSTPDKELRSEHGETLPIDDVRVLVARRIGRPDSNKAARRGIVRTRSGGRKKMLSFLRSLLKTRPDLRPQLNAVLSGQKPPSDDEIERLLADLRASGAVKEHDDENLG